MARRAQLQWILFAGLLSGQGAAQAVKLSRPLPLGPEANGERIFESALAGNRIVYRADQDARDVVELYSATLDGSGPVVKLHPALAGGSDVLSFVVSPDGARIVYVADQDADEDYSLFSVPADGSAAPVELAEDLDYQARQEQPQITSDGSRVVFRLFGYVLRSVAIDGSTPPTTVWQFVDAYELAPDGSHAVFVDDGFRVAHVYSVPLDGSASPVPLSFGEQAEVVALRIAPDGARAVYTAWGTAGSTSGPRELFSVPTDGSASRVRLSAALSSGRNVESFEITPDGGRVVYLADQVNSRFELFSAPVDGSAPALRISGDTIGDGDVAGSPAFELAPGGRTLVFRADREQDGQFRLYRAPIDGSAPPVRLTLHATGEFHLDRAGSYVVYLRDLGSSLAELWSVPLHRPRARDLAGNPLGVGPRRLSADLVAGGTVAGFQITPDSRRVVFHAQRDSLQAELFVTAIGGGAPALELSAPLVSGGEIGARVGPAYHVSADSVRVVYLADQEIDELVELYGVPIDRSLAPVKLNGPLDPGPVAGDVLGFELPSDGLRFVYLADGDLDQVYELYSGRLDGSAPVVKLNGPLVENGGVASGWSLAPDGLRVVYLADQAIDQRFELYSVPVDRSSGPVRLNNPIIVADVAAYRLSPAGDTVIYSLGLDDLYGVPIQGGVAAVPLHGSLDAVPAFIEFTADGRRVLFLSPSGAQFTDLAAKLYSAPVDGSEAPLELSAVSGNPADVAGVAAAARGNFAAYVADQEADERFELYGVPADGRGPPARLNHALVPGGDVTGMGIGARGDRVVYLADAEVDGVVEIFSVDLRGAPPARRSGGGATPAHVKLNGPLAAGEDVTVFALDPDGARAAFLVQDAAADARLFSVPVAGGAALVLSTAADSVQAFRFSPDGLRLVYLARTAPNASGPTRIFSAPADGSGAPVELNGALVPGGSVPTGQPAQLYIDSSFTISPDGQWVAYRADQDVDERVELFLRRIDGSGSPIRVNDALVAGGDVPGPFLFTADSHGIAYVADQDTDEVLELYLAPLP